MSNAKALPDRIEEAELIPWTVPRKAAAPLSKDDSLDTTKCVPRPGAASTAPKPQTPAYTPPRAPPRSVSDGNGPGAGGGGRPAAATSSEIDKTKTLPRKAAAPLSKDDSLDATKWVPRPGAASTAPKLQTAAYAPPRAPPPSVSACNGPGAGDLPNGWKWPDWKELKETLEKTLRPNSRGASQTIEVEVELPREEAELARGPKSDAEALVDRIERKQACDPQGFASRSGAGNSGTLTQVPEERSCEFCNQYGLECAGATPAAIKTEGMRLPKENPQVNDLRTFLRPGDILNYLGGNMWGHVVLLLATPRAVEIPILYDFQQGDSPPREIGRNVPTYICNNFQCASNIMDMSMSQCALVVHPERGEICPVKQRPDIMVESGGPAFQICAGRDGPVTMELVLSPLNHETLDIYLFRLVVSEMSQRPEDTKWSVRTAVRGYLAHAELHAKHYKTRKRKLGLVKEIVHRWNHRPVCSTVPPRVWAKYFLKVAFKEATSSTNLQDSQVLWIESVLKHVPVKDDSVLPKDLVQILLGTGSWHRLDLATGPPAHRRGDKLPREAVLYTEDWQPERTQFPVGLKNSKGLAVQLGKNGFNVYCGRKCAKPQWIWGAGRSGGEKVHWNGMCGPDGGPQCSECRWVEDTLLS